jgi:acyl-CoA thioesterase-1
MIKVIMSLFFLGSFNIMEAQERKTILFFGDSITAGYGIDSEDAFPAIIQGKLDSNNLNYRSVNAGLSGETSAGGVRRVEWVLQQRVDIFVLELGGNDGLRGLDPSDTKRNLQRIIDIVQGKNPEIRIILAGMEAPPNMGQDYTNAFRQVYSELAKENDLIFIPFILEGVAGNSELNLPDGIHPTEEGHKIVAELVWGTLRPLL